MSLHSLTLRHPLHDALSALAQLEDRLATLSRMTSRAFIEARPPEYLQGSVSLVLSHYQGYRANPEYLALCTRTVSALASTKAMLKRWAILVEYTPLQLVSKD